MKYTTKLISLLLLAALPFTLFAQGQTIVGAYMKVSQERYMEYPEVEKEWKKYHQKAIEDGMLNGWQLWRNVHAGIHDPYQYITLQWYDNYEHAIKGTALDYMPEGVYSDEEWAALNAKTMAARVYAYQEVAHLVAQGEEQQPVKYLVVGRMKAKPGMESEYVKMEKEIAKLFMDEGISRGWLAHWGVWRIYPFKEGQYGYTAVQGFSDAAQLDADRETIDPSEVGLDQTMDEIMELIQGTRDMVSVEVWELVDQVFPEE
jgi:hypothetical protein